MLTISDKEYLLPVKEVQEDGTVLWHIERKGASTEKIVAKHFQYTILISKINPEIHHVTFVYDGRSVKPAPRTLRLLGSDYAEGFTARLANNEARVEVRLGINSRGEYAVLYHKLDDDDDPIIL